MTNETGDETFEMGALAEGKDEQALLLNPPHDQLADDEDQLDWDPERDGAFADSATDVEGEPETEAFDAGVEA